MVPEEGNHKDLPRESVSLENLMKLGQGGVTLRKPSKTIDTGHRNNTKWNRVPVLEKMLTQLSR
jgi:hypothetical protein